MKLFKCISMAIVITVAVTINSSAQMCGDANSDATVNVLDMAITIDYLAGVAPTINTSNADCDGVTGVTIGDVYVMTSNLFRGGTLDCNVSGSYSLSPAPNDTIHIIRLSDVPSSVDEIFLLVQGSFDGVADAVYLPIQGNGTGSSNLFSVTQFFGETNTISGGTTAGANDHTIFAMPGAFSDWLNGVETVALMKYVRNTPGTGSIFPEAFDRTAPLEIAISRNFDLYKPVVTYHDYSYPEGTLHASEDQLTFAAFTDSPALDTFTVQISHGEIPVAYKLTTPTSWVQIDQPTGTTPATVTLTADATGLGALDYNGVIRVYYDGIYPLMDSINLTLSVHPPIDPFFPPGDINCDGDLNIIDLNELVNHIFRSGPAPFPCE